MRHERSRQQNFLQHIGIPLGFRIRSHYLDPLRPTDPDSKLHRARDLLLFEHGPSRYVLVSALLSEDRNTNRVDGHSVCRGEHDIGMRARTLGGPSIREAIDGVENHE